MFTFGFASKMANVPTRVIVALKMRVVFLFEALGTEATFVEGAPGNS